MSNRDAVNQGDDVPRPLSFRAGAGISSKTTSLAPFAHSPIPRTSRSGTFSSIRRCSLVPVAGIHYTTNMPTEGFFHSDVAPNDVPLPAHLNILSFNAFNPCSES